MSARLRALAAAALSAGLLVGTGLPSQASAPAGGAQTTGTSPAAAAPRTVAPRSAPTDGALRVATYNVCKKACGKGRFNWANRRYALVNAVRAADPDVLAVGQPAALPPRPSETLPTSGKASVHVFRRSANQWLPEARLEGSAVTASPCFGNELAVSGDLLAVRSQDLSSPEGVGSVWLYARRDGKWSFVQELVPAAGISKGRAYGLSLAISGGRVLVGDCTSRGADEIVPVGPGAVLVFEERGGSWTNTLRLMPKEPCGARSFGTDLSAEWPLVAVGRPRKERLGLEPGGAYVFDLTGK